MQFLVCSSFYFGFLRYFLTTAEISLCDMCVMVKHWLTTQEVAGKFDSDPSDCQVANLSELIIHVSLVTKQYILVPGAGQQCPEAGKVTVGLASH